MPGYARLTVEGWQPPRTFVAQTNAVVRRQLDLLRPEFQDIVRETAPVSQPGNSAPGHRPGTLRRGLVAQVHGPVGGVGEVTLTSAAPYTDYVLKGRGPIVARPGRTLRFWLNGQVVFRKSVGPAKANPFIQRAWPRVTNVFTARAILTRAALLDALAVAGRER